jgi:hypothetical protein
MSDIFRKVIHEVVEENSQVSQAAKAQGLEYMKFGRYGKNGKVTHKSQNGKLTPIAKSQKSTPQDRFNAASDKSDAEDKAWAKEKGSKEVNRIKKLYGEPKSTAMAKADADVATQAKRKFAPPSFADFKDSNAGAGKDVTKNDWHSYIDKNITAGLQKKIAPKPRPPVASKSDTEEAATKDFSKVLKQFKIKNNMPPRTPKGSVEPSFMASAIKHVKKFPYSNQIWNVFGGAGGEQPAWMPTIWK